MASVSTEKVSDFSLEEADIPQAKRAKDSPYTKLVEEFLTMGKDSTRVNFPDSVKLISVSTGIRNAIDRAKLEDKVAVVKRGEELYLSRKR